MSHIFRKVDLLFRLTRIQSNKSIPVFCVCYSVNSGRLVNWLLFEPFHREKKKEEGKKKKFVVYSICGVAFDIADIR